LFFALGFAGAHGGFAAAADLDRSLAGGAFKDHASLFELEDLVIAHRD
jgi:hypothetical protein